MSVISAIARLEGFSLHMIYESIDMFCRLLYLVHIRDAVG